MAHLEISLFGPMEARLDGHPVERFAYHKARALLAYLAVEADRPHLREALADLLWPEMSPDAARMNLRKVLTNLREAIEPGEAASLPPLLFTSRDTIQLNPASGFELDVSRFTALLEACEGHPHRHISRCPACASRLEQAARLYRGDFLAPMPPVDSSPFEEWAILKRENLHQRARDALSHLANYYENWGNPALARQFLVQLLALEPWNEEAHVHLIRLLALDGQRSAALAQYKTCLRILKEELDIEPLKETQAMVQRILDGVELTRSEPRLVGFPPASTQFVGRTAEMSALGDLLADPGNRLITIVGPGGVGKTRLTLESANQYAPAFAHGAVYLSLVGLDTADQLQVFILDTLGIPVNPAAGLEAQLLEFLREQELLLVLDNYEHFLPDVHLITQIVRAAPRVTLLLTSRERLGLRIEHVVELEGMEFPLQSTEHDLEHYSAVRMFVEAARRSQHSFQITADNAPAVARICKAVEGMPLALELAGAAVHVRPCAVLADEIEKNLDLLSSRFHDLPERHRSVQAAFEQSWLLLNKDEQQVFQRLGVFRGGCGEQAAFQIAGGSPAILASLIDKSLLRRDASGRYRMHELIVHFTAEKLASSSELEAVRRSHAAYYLGIAREAEGHIPGPDQELWLDRLEKRQGNLEAAFETLIEFREIESAIRLCLAVFGFWYIRTHFTEGRRWLQQVITLYCYQPGADLLAVRMFNAAGLLAQVQSDFTSAASYYQEALDLSKTLSEPRWTANLLNNLGRLAMLKGDFIQATPLLDQSLAAFRVLKDSQGTAASLTTLGQVALQQGKTTQATGLLEAALSEWKILGHQQQIAYTLISLADLASTRQELSRARTYYGRALQLLNELKDRLGASLVLIKAAALSVSSVPPEPVVKLLGALDVLVTELKTELSIEDQEAYGAAVEAARGRLDQAYFQSAWLAGRSMPLEQAVILAQQILEGDQLTR